MNWPCPRMKCCRIACLIEMGSVEGVDFRFHSVWYRIKPESPYVQFNSSFIKEKTTSSFSRLLRWVVCCFFFCVLMLPQNHRFRLCGSWGTLLKRLKSGYELVGYPAHRWVRTSGSWTLNAEHWFLRGVFRYWGGLRQSTDARKSGYWKVPISPPRPVPSRRH